MHERVEPIHVGPDGHVERGDPVGHRRHPHDSIGAKDADVVDRVGQDAGIGQSVSLAAESGEVETVGGGDVELMGAGHADFLECPLGGVDVRLTLHVLDRRGEGHHAVGPGVQEELVVHRGTDATPVSPNRGQQLHSGPRLIPSDVLRSSQVHVGGVVPHTGRQEPPRLELLKRADRPPTPSPTSSPPT